MIDLGRAASTFSTGTGRYGTALSTCTSQAEDFSLPRFSSSRQKISSAIHSFPAPVVCAPELRFKAVEPSGRSRSELKKARPFYPGLEELLGFLQAHEGHQDKVML